MYEIYCVTCLENGKKYVGQTSIGRTERWNQHRYQAKYDPHTYFYRSLMSRGFEVWELSLLEEVETLEQANEAEDRWIKELKTLNEDFGYNTKEGGSNGPLSESARKKSSETKKQQWSDPEFKESQRLANVGKHHTEEGKKNISLSLVGHKRNLGRVHSPEDKEKIRQSMRRTREEEPERWWGRPKGPKKSKSVIDPNFGIVSLEKIKAMSREDFFQKMKSEIAAKLAA